MRGLPFFKPKNTPQFAGLNFSESGGGGGTIPTDVNNLLNITAQERKVGTFINQDKYELCIEGTSNDGLSTGSAIQIPVSAYHIDKLIRCDVIVEMNSGTQAVAPYVRSDNYGSMELVNNVLLWDTKTNIELYCDYNKNTSIDNNLIKKVRIIMEYTKATS